jgi:hypothetical protein
MDYIHIYDSSMQHTPSAWGESIIDWTIYQSWQGLPASVTCQESWLSSVNDPGKSLIITFCHWWTIQVCCAKA